MEPDLRTFFATPIIRVPGQTPEEWQAEMDKMFARSKLTNDFIDGKVSPTDFCDLLSDHSINPYDCLDDWEEGVQYI